VSWSAGNCSGTISPTSNGATNSVTNGNAGYTGNAIFSCSAGSYSYVSGSCTASAGAVHGVCGSTHYNCTSGTMAADWTNGSGYYSWSCLGSGGGSDASCSEDSTSDYPIHL
jgi:Tfp pilus assembly protein PilX